MADTHSVGQTELLLIGEVKAGSSLSVPTGKFWVMGRMNLQTWNGQSHVRAVPIYNHTRAS